MRTTGYEKPAGFRSNTEPESVREVGTGGNEMEAMRAQQEKFEPSSPPPVINLSPSISSSPTSKSWSELSQSNSKVATLSLDASEPVQGKTLEGSGGKSWGEVRSDAEGGVKRNLLRSQLAKGAATLEKVTGDIGEENEYGSGKETSTITKEKKEEKVEEKAAETVKEKEDTGQKSDTDEEKLESERTMEGLAESSEETNSLQAFRAVEKRLSQTFCLKHVISKLPFWN